jgi:hypothetical protein
MAKQNDLSYSKTEQYHSERYLTSLEFFYIKAECFELVQKLNNIKDETFQISQKIFNIIVKYFAQTFRYLKTHSKGTVP